MYCMKRTLFFAWFGLLIAASLLACAQAPITMPAAYAGRRIQVGSGGGFSGLATMYYLLDNGRLFRKQGPDTTARLLRRLSARTTRNLFTQLETHCRIRTTDFNHPGNVYQFVSWHRGKQVHTVTWGADDHVPPNGIPQFYQQFLTLIPVNPSPKS